MKKHFSLFLVVAAAVAIFAGCCTTRTVSYKTVVCEPVYKSLSEIRNGVKAESPRELKNPGKIWIFGDYLFIVERGEGIHIIDNSNPRAPQSVSFVTVPGVGDIAVKHNILYADSYIDLVAIDISDIKKPREVKRVEGIFPNPLDRENLHFDKDKGLLVDWIEKDTVIAYTYTDCGDNAPVYIDRYGDYAKDGRVRPVVENGSNQPSSVGKIGKGGSMARFTLYQNYLYSVDISNLQTFDISNPENPKPWAKVNVGWNIETIFPYGDKLFIGSQTGMFIYDASVPWNPTYLGQFQHVRGCDPVVVEGKYAYVTIREGTRCPGNQNQLDILDISNLMKPILLKTYPMQQPAGLGVDGNILIICDGMAGLKVFDVHDPFNIQLLNWQSGIQTYDVIMLNKYAIMIGSDGLFQYDYSDPKNLILLSTIPIKK